jgi:hypothetical protein
MSQNNSQKKRKTLHRTVLCYTQVSMSAIPKPRTCHEFNPQKDPLKEHHLISPRIGNQKTSGTSHFLSSPAFAPILYSDAAMVAVMTECRAASAPASGASCG